MDQYLAFSDDAMTTPGAQSLGKLLFVQREAMYLKHVLRQAMADRETTERLFAVLGISWPDYMRFLSKRLRRILKVPQMIPEFQHHDHLTSGPTNAPLGFVQHDPMRFLCIFDFAQTPTNSQFIALAKRLMTAKQGVGQFWVCSAHGHWRGLSAFLSKHHVPIKKTQISALGSVAAKLRHLYDLALSADQPLMLYVDEEVSMGEAALLLSYHAYVVQKTAPLLKMVGFKQGPIR